MRAAKTNTMGQKTSLNIKMQSEYKRDTQVFLQFNTTHAYTCLISNFLVIRDLYRISRAHPSFLHKEDDRMHRWVLKI